MISWTQSTEAATGSSFLVSKAGNFTTSRSGTVLSVEGTSSSTVSNTSFTKSSLSFQSSSSRDNSGSTWFSYQSVTEQRGNTSTTIENAGFATSAITNVTRFTTLWTETYTSSSAQLTTSRTSPFVPSFVSLIGSIYFSDTKETTSVQTSTISTQSSINFATTTGTSPKTSWSYSKNENGNVIFYSGTQSEGATKTTFSTTTLTLATTTHLSDTEYVAELYNTIYQAQTDAFSTDGAREVIWVATKVDAGTGSESIAPFEAAANIATTATRTTVFANTQTISLAPMTRPGAFSLYRSTLTNASVGQMISASETMYSTKQTTFAAYGVFPPETFTGVVSFLTTRSTVSSFTNIVSNTILIEYSQSTNTTQWYSSAKTYLANFPEAAHNRTHSDWTSKEITTSTQNKYITTNLISGTDTAVTGNTNFYSESGNETTSLTRTNTFEVGGNSFAQLKPATFGTVDSNKAEARMSVFGPRGAVAESENGFRLTINLPNESLNLTPAYTASDGPSMTTVFPRSWSLISAGKSYSVSIYGKSASYTKSDSTTSTSQSALFGAAGETAVASTAYLSWLGGVSNSHVLEVLPGAYKIIGPSQSTTTATSGGVFNGSDFSDPTWWRPVTFVVPSSQASTAVLWTALRNITAIP